MNRRQWKKACKRAAVEIERRWPGEYEIVAADGDETVCPPSAFVPPGKPPAGAARRMWRVGFRYASPPRGTPVVWTHDSYTRESDCVTTLDVLNERRFEESFDWDKVGRELDACIPSGLPTEEFAPQGEPQPAGPG